MALDTPAAAEHKLPPPRRRWASVAMGLALLLSGVIIGVSITLAFLFDRLMVTLHEPEKIPPHVASRMSWRLGLDEEQTRATEAIYARLIDDLLRVRDDALPEIDAALDRTRRDMLEMLTPDQAEKYTLVFDVMRQSFIPKATPVSESSAPVDPP